MKTRICLLPLACIESPRWYCFTLMFALALIGAWRAPGANILWVSDTSATNTTGGMFSGPGSGMTDSPFVTLLQNAGHNVMRFNGPDNQNTLLTAAELAAINTNDLIIIGRASGSGAWRLGQGTQWNTNVVKPLICMSPYLIRTIPTGTGAGVDNRMGWFTGDSVPDNIPCPATATLPADPAVDFLLSGLQMIGNSTVNPFDEMLDRNTSFAGNTPVTGGRTLISATFAREDNATVVTAHLVTEFPVGTIVTLSNTPLAAYRMFFAGGSREGATTPNAIPSYTGRETLTSEGETLFLRAVVLALNSGVPPVTNPLDPVGFTVDPASATVLQGRPISFSVALTGAAPRTVVWQRDTGDGMTFTNIPGATTPFTASKITLSAVDVADDNAKFRVIASNPINNATSAVATLTVTKDTVGPVLLSAVSVEGTNISVCFDEKLDLTTANDSLNYIVADGESGTAAVGASLRPNGRDVDLRISTVNPTLAPTFTLEASLLEDVFHNGAPTFNVSGVNLGFTAVDIGTVNPSGSHFGCASNSFQVSGGGLNIVGNADQLRFLYKTVTGNFDARVRVSALTGADRLESYAKAALVAREDTSAGAGNMTVFATPSYPGDNNVSTTVRTNASGLTGNLGTPVGPNGFPNGWLRITRVDNLFTSYRSLDGMNWTQLGSITLAYGPSMVVGAGVNSHRNGRLATGTFNDFSIATGPTIGWLMYSAGSFSGSFQTVAGYSYRVQYKDNITTPTWQSLTTIPGDGSVKSFTDPGPAVPQRYYRVVIQ